MSLFKRVKESIIRNYENKKQGKYNGIPVPFKRLSQYFTSWEKGMSIGILGQTGSGKSTLTRYLYIYEAYKFYKETGYGMKILYFPLEDNKEKVYKNIIRFYLNEVHGIVISSKELDSKCDRVLPDFVLAAIEQAEEYFTEFESVVSIIDSTHNIDNLYAYCEDFALKQGVVKKEQVDIGGTVVEEDVYYSDLHVIAIFDNLSNLEGGRGETERETMIRFCKSYIREKLCNFFNWTCIQVIQSDFQSERQQFTSGGESVVAKLEPSLASVGDAKTITRSMHLVLSLFDPSRFDILQFPRPPKTDMDNCYDIGILRGRFRSLRIIKSNDSDTGIRVYLLFDALTESFKELPPPKTNELQQIYNKYREKQAFTPQQGVIMTNYKAFEENPF